MKHSQPLLKSILVAHSLELSLSLVDAVAWVERSH
jgi:hypothetical protein